MADNQKEIDEHSGVDTTGHEWDGIKELNNPLPKWWVYTFYITCIWAVLYWIAMPAIPLASSYTKGVLGYSQRQVVADEIAAANAKKAVWADRLMSTPLEKVSDDPQLMTYVMSAAGTSFGDNCATCHGTGAQGSKGYPNLNDDDWLWGGTLEEIQTTIQYGIRSEHEETRYSEMPFFVKDGLLERDQVRALAEYVLALSGEDHDAALAASAAETYEFECASCHMEDGAGDIFVGAPNLKDKIWLHGEGRDAIIKNIGYMKAGVMPAWKDRLDEATIRSLAIYVHSLGGGQ